MNIQEFVLNLIISLVSGFIGGNFCFYIKNKKNNKVNKVKQKYKMRDNNTIYSNNGDVNNGNK